MDSSVAPPRLITWSTINANPAADKTNLEVVADGMEDMQIVWACDDDLDGLYQENTSDLANDEWANNVASDNPPACGRPEVVRLTLIARSASSDMWDKTGHRPTAEDLAVTVERMVEVVGTGFLVTIRVSWVDLSLGGRTDTIARSTLKY